MAWTEEKRNLVIAEYVDTMQNEYETDEERAASTMEVVAELAEKHGETVNGVRNVLTKADVYIRKQAATKASTASSGGTAKRINKADALQELQNTIGSIDPELVDAELISKLTGKVAAYFTGILVTVLSKE